MFAPNLESATHQDVVLKCFKMTLEDTKLSKNSTKDTTNTRRRFSSFPATRLFDHRHKVSFIPRREVSLQTGGDLPFWS